METNRMGQMYQEIAKKLNDLIPDNWKKIYLYAEVIFRDSTMVYFYFNTHENEQFTYYYYIPSKYNIEKTMFKKEMNELYELLEGLHQEFRDNNPEMWTNLTLILESTGKFSISYDYEDILASELTNMERRTLFAYNHMRILPVDERERKFLENYLKRKSD